MINELLSSLNSRILNATYLFAFRALPSLAIKVIEKLEHVERVNKIKECISNIAFTSWVFWKVKEVKFIVVYLFHFEQEFFRAVFIGNVSNYNWCSLIIVWKYLLFVDNVLLNFSFIDMLSYPFLAIEDWFDFFFWMLLGSDYRNSGCCSLKI